MIIKKLFSFFCIILFFSCGNLTTTDYYKTPLYSSQNILNAIVEIPAGTNKKFEYNKTTKSFEIDKKNGKDRIINYLPYVGNYGFIPSTFSDPKLGGDGDALDVLILSESYKTGDIVEIIPIAMLKLIDDNEIDYKIIAIPFDESKQVIKTQNYSAFSNEHPSIKEVIELWFLNYNKDDEAKIEGWADEKEALLEISKNAYK